MLIVEDGSIVPGAESYASASQFTAYHTGRGNDVSGVADIEVALRRATDYMTQQYRLEWLGQRVSINQPLDWPRYLVQVPDGPGGFGSYGGYGYIQSYLPSNIVPLQVINACCELALRAATGPLTVDLGQEVKRVKVDVIEKEYFEGSTRQKQYAAVDYMLTPLLKGFGMVRLVRA